MCYYLNVQFQGQRVNIHKPCAVIYGTAKCSTAQCAQGPTPNSHTSDVNMEETYRNLFTPQIILRGCSDKSVARPGRKQATTTILGIYSTYSPRSSIHFLACCSKFCKPRIQNSESCPTNQVSTAAMTSASDEK